LKRRYAAAAAAADDDDDDDDGDVGCDPHIMGIGPVPAVEALLKASGISQQDIDLFDVRQHCCFFFPFIPAMFCKACIVSVTSVCVSVCLSFTVAHARSRMRHCLTAMSVTR